MKKIFLFIVLAFSLSTNAQESKLSKTDEVLSKAVEKGIALAEKTGSFVIEQAPLLLQEFYNWHIAKSVFGIILGISIMFIGYNVRKIWGKKVDKNYSKDWNEIVINGVASEEVSTTVTIAISFIFGITAISINAYNLIFILVAPKLYLIEYFIK